MMIAKYLVTQESVAYMWLRQKEHFINQTLLSGSIMFSGL